jgi:hypothetical protein
VTKAVGDHFSQHAASYADARPTYPASLMAFLASVSPARRLAWDVGTGSGQAAVLLGDEFERVVATDPSAEQLAHAKAHPRVEYRIGREAGSGLPGGSVDLVTVAQAAHWFDLPAFYDEVRRVAAPGAAIAMWCYSETNVSEAIDPVIAWFQHERIGPYWPAGREHVDAGYRTLDFPFAPIAAPAFVMERPWTRDQLTAYLETSSALQRARKAEGGDPLVEFTARLAPLWPDPAERRRVSSPINLLLGRV